MAAGSDGGTAAPRKNTPTDYLFGRIIGEGSFSTVYLAKEVKTNKEVAIKICNKNHIIREKKQKAVMREKEILCKIKDGWSPTAPFFVKLISSFQDAESLYFVLTYAKSGDFFSFLRKTIKKEVDVTQFYAGELLQAVEHLHRLGIVHRDLKPENILLSGSMHILITDFGSGLILRQDKDDVLDEERATKSRTSFVGTAQYVSPEVLTSKSSSPASDLWAIGCILYQMVSGMPPFQSASEYLIFQKIQRLEYSFHEGFHPEVRDLVESLLRIEPSERLGSGDMAEHGAYLAIKQHPFFRGLMFDQLHQTSPPFTLHPSSSCDSPADDPIWAKYPEMTPGLGAENRTRLLKESLEDSSLTSEDESGDGGDEVDATSLSSETSCIPESGNIGDLTNEQREKLLGEQQRNNEYHRFVEGNLILKQGILDKKKGLWSRRRMFLLTEGPRLFYVDPKDKELKGEIPWSADMRTEMKNFKIFFIHTPNRVYYLIDPTSFASKWCEAIDSVRGFYFR